MSSVMSVSGRRVALSTHAVARYRSRVARHATRESIERAVQEGALQRTRPGWVVPSAHSDAYLVTPAGVVFMLRATGGTDRRDPTAAEFIATTCLVHRRTAKPDQRQWREQDAATAWSAA